MGEGREGDFILSAGPLSAGSGCHPTTRGLTALGGREVAFQKVDIEMKCLLLCSWNVSSCRDDPFQV